MTVNVFKIFYSMLNTFCATIYELGYSLIHRDNALFLRRLATKLSSKNILYIKLFQAIALNKNLINDETNNELMKFTDSVPYENDHYESDFDHELLCKIKDEYNLDWHTYQPMKGGMISLVFRMCDKNTNKNVIIKMKRKNIDEKLAAAIEEVQTLSYIILFFSYFNTLDIPIIFHKNIESLKQQLDYKQEVENMLEASEKCRNLKYVKIPEVYKEITDKYPDVIVMEYVEGKTIQELDEEEYKFYAEPLLKYGMVSLLLHGVTHGDLHPGNILFLKNENEDKDIYKICLLDFGLVFRIEEEVRLGFFYIITKLFDIPAKDLSLQLLTLFIEPKGILNDLPNEDLEKIVTLIEPIIEKTIYKKNEANQSKIYEFLTEINGYIKNNNIKKYGLRVSDEFVKMQMALAMCNGINMTLCKNDYMSFANKIINEMFDLDVLKEDDE